MTSVAPQKGRKDHNRGSGSPWRGFLLEKVGKIKVVCQLPGTEGVYSFQEHVCICCFF